VLLLSKRYAHKCNSLLFNLLFCLIRYIVVGILDIYTLDRLLNSIKFDIPCNYFLPEKIVWKLELWFVYFIGPSIFLMNLIVCSVSICSQRMYILRSSILMMLMLSHFTMRETLHGFFVVQE